MKNFHIQKFPTNIACRVSILVNNVLDKTRRREAAMGSLFIHFVMGSATDCRELKLHFQSCQFFVFSCYG